MLATILLSTLQASVPQLALLDDGTRLLVIDEVSVGSYLVQTPYGLLRSDGQQVVELHDAEAEIELLEPLRGLDYASWIHRLGERGLLDRLLAEPIDENNRALLLPILEGWGERIDPLPPGCPPQERVPEMWQRLLAAEDGERAMLLGAIGREIREDPQDPWHRLDAAKWHAGIAHGAATVRWAAARIAGLQLEPDAAPDLLELSFQDEDFWVAEEAARALLQVDRHGALVQWAKEVAEGRKTRTARRAARFLGTLGPEHEEAIRLLIDRLRLFALRTGGSCGTAASEPLGLPVADEAELETTVPGNLLKLATADVLEKAIAPGGLQPAEEQVPVTVTSQPEESAGEAWRSHLAGR